MKVLVSGIWFKGETANVCRISSKQMLTIYLKVYYQDHAKSKLKNWIGHHGLHYRFQLIFITKNWDHFNKIKMTIQSGFLVTKFLTIQSIEIPWFFSLSSPTSLPNNDNKKQSIENTNVDHIIPHQPQLSDSGDWPVVFLTKELHFLIAALTSSNSGGFE